MKSSICIGVLLLAVLPAFGQDDDSGGDFDLFGGVEFGTSDSGQRGGAQAAGPGPVEHINEILTKGGHPLRADQTKTLQALLDEQMEAIRQAMAQAPGAQRGPDGGPPAVGRPVGEQAPSSSLRSGAGGAAGRSERSGMGGRAPLGARRAPNPQLLQQEEIYLAKVMPVLTLEQQGVWKKYQSDQIRARGGYPALKLALQEAGSPPAPAQEAQLQEQFQTYSQQLRDLRASAAPGSQPDAAKLKELESQHLAALVKLLDPAQRKALLEWRRSTQPSPQN